MMNFTRSLRAITLGAAVVLGTVGFAQAAKLSIALSTWVG